MIKFGFISLDIIIILILFLVLFFFSFRHGKRTLVSLILSTYPALLIFKNFPYIKFNNGTPEAIGFLVIYLIIFFILYKNIQNKKVYTPIRKITDYGLLTLTFLSLIMAISSKSIPALQKLYTFSGFLPNFINKIDFGLILLIPIILILLTNNSDRY